MSGMIGKAMRFARSPQGKQALSKAQGMFKSRGGRDKPEDGTAAQKRPADHEPAREKPAEASRR